MFGKIVQLLGIPLEDGFKVEYGISVRQDCTVDLEFARISLAGASIGKKQCTYCGAYLISKLHDNFKDILLPIFNEKYLDSNRDIIEEYLLVIIPYAAIIETTAKKIAGRYSTEAILEMHIGDTVKVEKAGAIPETYMVVQAGNELFLVKKNR